MALALALGGAAARAAGQEAAAEPRRLEPVPAPIVNGVTSVGFPSVALLLARTFGGDHFPFCSGTLIGCRTVLTAAHCFCPSTPCVPEVTNRFVFLQHGGLFAIESAAVHPSFEFGVAGDFVVLRLASPVDGVAPTPINTVARPAPGTPGTIVGYGTRGGPSLSAGVKFAGAVTTAACRPEVDAANHQCWLYEAPIGPPGTHSNTCLGDSGGPLFVDQGGGPVVAGVTSGGFSENCLEPDSSFDADVFVERAWIAGQAGGDLANATCGALPQAGTDLAPIFAAEGTLDFGNEEDRYFLEVPPGTSRVRFTLSHDDSGDFGLYVRRGQPPSTFVADCASQHRGWDVCDFEAPGAGAWHVLVDRLTGSGLYQLTVTLFGAVDTGDTSPCVRDADTACLLGGRFEVEVDWATASGAGTAQVMAFAGARAESDQSAFFWFFNPANFEMGVKMVDACAPPFGRFWAFVSGLTNQGFTVRVRDTVTGREKRYANPIDNFPTTVGDTNAFDCDE
jgi:hypothetical protein